MKVKSASASRRLRFHGQDLASFIIAAGRTGRMRSDGAAALRALVELRRPPAVRRLARAQPHLRGFAFWNSHIERLTKAGIPGKARAWPAIGGDFALFDHISLRATMDLDENETGNRARLTPARKFSFAPDPIYRARSNPVCAQVFLPWPIPAASAPLYRRDRPHDRSADRRTTPAKYPRA